MRNSGRLKPGYFPLRAEEGTCPRSGRIAASNPCSEYMFLDDSACNLASLNLLR
jgi:ribonucleotide reductase alpha subunit